MTSQLEKGSGAVIVSYELVDCRVAGRGSQDPVS
jgi:hypothetical protein